MGRGRGEQRLPDLPGGKLTDFFLDSQRLHKVDVISAYSREDDTDETPDSDEHISPGRREEAFGGYASRQEFGQSSASDPDNDLRQDAELGRDRPST